MPFVFLPFCCALKITASIRQWGSQPSYYGISWSQMGVNGILWDIPTELSTALLTNSRERKANQRLTLKEETHFNSQRGSNFFHKVRN